MLLDRLKRMATVAIEIPSHVEKIAVVIEQKAAAEGAALKREAEALENAVTPDVMAEIEKIESALAHVPGLGALIAQHAVVKKAAAAVEAALATPAPATVSPGSNAVPTTPVL